MTDEEQRTLTPYDTGAVLEPTLWVTRENIDRWPGPDYIEQDRYGKVDFDDDEDRTIATVHVTRNDDGTHTLHVLAHVDASELTISREG